MIFCDGTWNSPEEEKFGQPTDTNVHKLFISCQDEAESNGEQITWYQPGVGSDVSWYRRAFEGATGTGTGLNIRRGYAAIAAHYRDGDRIFLVGFSRGAFAARSIAGMIEKVGLLREASRRSVEQAYELYRRVRSQAAPELEAHRSGRHVHRNVRIHAIGVWDTVGALGLSMWGWSFNFRGLWRNSFHRLSPNQITSHVFHALAIDEKRTSFVPVAWSRTLEGRTRDALGGGKESTGPVVEETWFRGVHSDIGGGYADAGLSDITLSWMAERLSAAGLLLRPHMPIVSPNPLARIHNSARGPLWTNVATWPRWAPLRMKLEQEKSDPLGSILHESVGERERLGERSGLAEQRRRFLSVGERARVVVRARYQWEYTGIVLERGAVYRLRASGYWQDWKDSPVGPAGQPRSQESLLKRLAVRMKRVPQANWFELIALPCHDFGWRWQELGISRALYYLLINDPRQFKAQYVPTGGDCLITGPKREEAMLWCFANDARRFYTNNAGSVLLEVERIS